MSGGGSANYSRSDSETTIDPIQKEFLRSGWKLARRQVLNQPLEYYGGQTVADQDPATLEAYDAALERARMGNATVGAAEGYTQDVLGGRYLSPESNPYLRGTYDLASRAVTENYRDAVLPLLESRFAGAGQTRSAGYMGARSRADQALGRSLGDLATNIYGGAYDAERGRQESARSASQMFADEDFRNINAINDVGARRTQYQQSLLDDLLARFNFRRDEPFLRIGRYTGLIGSPTTVSDSSSRSFGASGYGGVGAG
jgi:hypothetical protein